MFKTQRQDKFLKPETSILVFTWSCRRFKAKGLFNDYMHKYFTVTNIFHSFIFFSFFFNFFRMHTATSISEKDPIKGNSMVTREIKVMDKDKKSMAAYITTVPGQRGNPKLVLNGFTYIPNKRIGDKTYWNCSLVRQKKCKARLISTGSTDNILITHPIHSHSEEYIVQ